MSGLSSGLQSAGKGVLAGAAALIAAPAIGAKAEGATGFFKGLGAGLVSAVVLPVVGVGVGATQARSHHWSPCDRVGVVNAVS